MLTEIFLSVLKCFAVFKTQPACLALILVPQPPESCLWQACLCPGGPASPPAVAGPPETVHGTGQGTPGSVTTVVATTLTCLPHVCTGTSISSDQQ